MDMQAAQGPHTKDESVKGSQIRMKHVSGIPNGIHSEHELAPKRARFNGAKSQDMQPQQKKGKPTKTVRVGSRRSQLALFQTNFVVDMLRSKNSDVEYEIVPMSTTGDKILNMPLSKIGQKSLFTKELEVALENGEVDMIVHSLKDLPTTLPEGMVIGAICRRDSPYDAVVFRPDHQKSTLGSLPKGSVVGTSSLRRIAQLKRSYPNLNFESVRGNLNTRLRKLDEDGTYVCLILAAAGLTRMDLSHRISLVLSTDECMYAVGQGAIAIECKENDKETLEFLSTIAHKETTLRCIAERAFMKTLEGGCSAPVAVCSSVEDEKITLKGGVFSLDGSKSVIDSVASSITSKNNNSEENNNKQSFCAVVAPHLPQCLLRESEQLGTSLANCLLHKGAKEILSEARAQNESFR